MQRIACFSLVFFISFEFLLVLIAAGAWMFMSQDLERLASGIAPSNDAIKYLALLPVGLLVWVFKETSSMIHESKHADVSNDWGDYSKFRAHVGVARIYAILFSFISFIPFFLPKGVSDGRGLLFLGASVVGGLIVALSVYLAKDTIKEMLIKR